MFLTFENCTFTVIKIFCCCGGSYSGIWWTVEYILMLGKRALECEWEERWMDGKLGVKFLENVSENVKICFLSVFLLRESTCCYMVYGQKVGILLK